VWTNVQVSLRSDKTLLEDLSIFIITWSFLLKMRNVSDKNRRDYQNTHFMFNKFLCQNRAVYEIKSEYIVEPDMLQIIQSNAEKLTHLAVTACFSAATLVTRTCLNVTLYIHCLSCEMSNSVLLFINKKFQLNVVKN
jgi:hypothetical protein